LEITLRINKEDKVFSQEFVPLKIYRKALEIENYARSQDVDSEKLLDKRLALVVEIFEKQFTKDQVENGLNAINHNDVLYDIIGVGILGYVSREKLEKEEDSVGKFLRELQESASQSPKQ
jgi:hypothetical protein